MRATEEQIAQAPKVALHEHLDGGVRPATVAEIADEIGHDLPAEGGEALGEWFEAASSSGSLERYLETFVHTVAVMQRPEDLTRVAREAVLDLADDGCVYAALRWAPAQHLSAGLSLSETIEAVQAGIHLLQETGGQTLVLAWALRWWAKRQAARSGAHGAWTVLVTAHDDAVALVIGQHDVSNLAEVTAQAIEKGGDW